MKQLKKIVPTLLQTKHKGQNGRIGVIGGSLEFSGSPFYAAISILKGGGDLAHIFCTKQAAIPIKSYSPEVIVHPYLISCSDTQPSEFLFRKNEALFKVGEWVNALHGFVLGTGLGRDKYIEEYICELLNLMDKQIIVIDGDGLWYLRTKCKEKMEKYIISKPKQIILSPNYYQFKKLKELFLPNERFPLIEDRAEQIKKRGIKDLIIQLPIDDDLVKDVAKLSQRLNNVTIFRKGSIDIASNGKKAYLINQDAAEKRLRSVQDIQAGLIALYGFWAQQFGDYVEDPEDKPLLGCALASYIARKASQKAYETKRFALTGPRIIEQIGATFNEFYFKM